jgi:protein TonB
MGRRIEGRVELMFTVLPDGRVTDLRVVDAQPSQVFDECALAAARHWRFAPIPAAVTTTRALRVAPPRG